jgi:hypothetical protein
LSATAITDETVDLFGLTCEDMQEDIVIGEDAITGTLKAVTDYTGFSSDTELQSGNFIALKFESIEGATITVTVTNPVELDEDGIVVLRIADKSTQTITVVASKDGQTLTKEYSLTGLTTL